MVPVKAPVPLEMFVLLPLVLGRSWELMLVHWQRMAHSMLLHYGIQVLVVLVEYTGVAFVVFVVVPVALVALVAL
jgi:hypothetical protein